MQLALPVPEPDNREERPRPELVTTPPSHVPHEPEQMVLRLLTLVTEKINEVHAGQRSLSADLREIKQNLPVQRKPLSVRSQALHVHVIWTRRNGLCPCCQEQPVCSDAGRLDGSEYDHFYARDRNRANQTWLVCGDCNRQLRDTEFKSNARSSFEAYQAALRPFLGRQMPLALFEAAGGDK